MPFFVVKIIRSDGWVLPPIVANFSNEEEVLQAVRIMADDGDSVVVKGGMRDDVMRAAFGEMPEGCASFRHDWTWSGDVPKPY